MKFLHIFFNYLRFVWNQGSSAYLTMIYPLLLIAIIGFGLSMGTSEKIPVAYIGDDPLFSSLNNQSNIIMLKVQDQTQLEAYVRQKKAVMGVAVYITESGKNIDIYLDSTKQAVASNLLVMIEKLANEEKANSGASLGSIQRKLAPMLLNIKQKKIELLDFSKDLEGFRQNITSAKNELIEGKKLISNYRTELVGYSEKLSEIDSYVLKLDTYGTRLNTISTDLNSKQKERDAVSIKLTNYIYKIDLYITKINNILSYLYYVRQNVPSNTEIYTYLEEMEKELIETKLDLANSKIELIQTKDKLDSIDFQSLKDQIYSVNTDLILTKNNLQSFRQSASSRISTLLIKLDEIEGKLDKAILKLGEIDYRVSELLPKISESYALMDSLVDPLEDFLGKRPEDLLPPKTISRSVFSNKKWMDIFFPSILAIDLLLSSILLPMIIKVRLREQGVEMRLFRSKAGTLSVVLGEFFANYLLSFFQIILISIIGILLFSIQIQNWFGFFFLILTLPAVFTSIGIFLAQIVNKSSTAFLLSLIIGIPMIFISGSIIPLEYLNPTIATLGRALPLFISIDFGEKLIFRGSLLSDLSYDYAYLISLIGICLVSSIIIYYKKR